MDEIKKITQQKMDDCIRTFVSYLNTLRTVRVSPSILDTIYVNYLGKSTQLCKLSSIVVENFNTLKINLFDITIKKNVEKSIINSDLGLTPISTGSSLKIIFPALTEERRKSYIKLAKNTAEKSRVCIRNIRRNANEKLKRFLKNKLINSDIERNLQNEIQNITNQYIENVNKILKNKEEELVNM
ncbi:MAG: ribosome recycling factor [Buchnera aphidicola (Schlechtendalia chinensis)]